MILHWSCLPQLWFSQLCFVRWSTSQEQALVVVLLVLREQFVEIRGTRQPLPGCLEAYIKDMFPNEGHPWALRWFQRSDGRCVALPLSTSTSQNNDSVTRLYVAISMIILVVRILLFNFAWLCLEITSKVKFETKISMLLSEFYVTACCQLLMSKSRYPPEEGSTVSNKKTSSAACSSLDMGASISTVSWLVDCNVGWPGCSTT